MGACNPLSLSNPPSKVLGPAPRAALVRELARAAGGIALLPQRTFDYIYCRDALAEEVWLDCRSAPAPVEDAPGTRLPERPVRIFLSCAEASGEIHGARLARALVEQARAAGAPAPELVGLGGERLREAGVRTIADPVQRSAMGFESVLGSLPYYSRLIEDTARSMRDWRPDLFLPVDSPALHVPLAHVAQSYRVPVVHLVAPQYWAWAPWRLDGYRRAVDLALTILPFEREWFARRGVSVRHVGHPLLDRLIGVPARSGPTDRGETLCILPGSRSSVIDRNLPWMLELIAPFEARHPGAPIRIVQETEQHRGRIEGLLARSASRAQLTCGDLHGELSRARCAFSVSGTVLIDLLHHRLPTLVIYRLESRIEEWLSRHLLTAPYFASINLLAGEEVVPEHSFVGDGPRERIRAQLELAWDDPEWRKRCHAGLERAARRLGPAGAIERAAGHSLELLGRRIVTPGTTPNGFHGPRAGAPGASPDDPSNYS